MTTRIDRTGGSLDRRGAPRTRTDYVRTCGHLRTLIERQSLASDAEITEVWPPRGKSAAIHEWAYCWAQLCRFLERGSSGSRGQVGDDLKESVAALILAREPIRIRIAGRPVGVTFRGLAALILLARHDLARRDAERDIRQIASLAAEAELARAEGRISRNAFRRRAKRLRQLHDRLYRDLLHHTRVVLANALTPDGGSVPEDEAEAWLREHAPWWERITPAEEQALFWALYAAGPARLNAMGDPPGDGRKTERAWREDMGFWTLLGWFFREHGVSPEALDVDLAQFMTLVRVGTPYFPPPERERKEPVH